MFANKQASVISELKKALTAANTPDLIPYDLEQTLYEELLNLQPLLSLMSFGQAEGLTHEYRLKTSHPMAWFEGEESTATNKQGAYTRKTVALKIGRIWGSVSGFAQAVDERFINALAEELAGSVQGMSDLFEFGAIYGAADDIGFMGDAYQYSGILPRMYAYAAENVVDAGGNKIELADLDSAIAASAKHRQTRTDPYMWIMGLQMKQVVDGLQTKVSLPLSSVTLQDGRIEMAAYGNRPIYESDYTVPESATTSPACTGTIASGGALAAATYKYRISSVTASGEQVGGTESSGVVASGGNLKGELTWTADGDALQYMIWRKKDSGAYQLLDIIPALTYSAAGVVNGQVESYTDAGAKTPKAVKPLESGEQMIVTMNMNPARGASFIGKVDDMGRQVGNAISFVELARVKDSYDYFLKTYSALKLPYPNLVGCIRHAKLS